MVANLSSSRATCSTCTAAGADSADECTAHAMMATRLENLGLLFANAALSSSRQPLDALRLAALAECCM